jgi:hypothetical protein
VWLLRVLTIILFWAGCSQAQNLSPEEKAEVDQVLLSREVHDLIRWYFSVGHDFAFDNPEVIGGMIAMIMNEDVVKSAIALRDQVWPLTKTARLSKMQAVPRQQYYNEVARCIRTVTEDMIQRGMWIVVASVRSEVGKTCTDVVADTIKSRTRSDCRDLDGDLPVACRLDSDEKN